MRDIKQEELQAYLDMVGSSSQVPEGYQQPVKMLEDYAVHNYHFVQFLLTHFAYAMATGGIETAVFSNYCVGFQMGRDFELRHAEAKSMESLLKEPA